jgi:hypothetical protein
MLYFISRGCWKSFPALLNSLNNARTSSETNLKHLQNFLLDSVAFCCCNSLDSLQQIIRQVVNGQVWPWDRLNSETMLAKYSLCF